jgi:hypothetical protein
MSVTASNQEREIDKIGKEVVAMGVFSGGGDPRESMGN